MIHNKYKNVVSFFAVLFFAGLIFSSCKKLIEIDPPTRSITTDETFNDSSNANAAIMGIYANMINTTNPVFTNGAITIFCGLSADELVNFSSLYTSVYTPSLNTLTDRTASVLWSKAYPIIYQANASIEGCEASTGLSQAAKDQFIGEAKFIRALCYFYLVNLYGDVPYITSSSWEKSSIASKTSKDQIYQSIIDDLKDAQSQLPSDYSISGGERIRANKSSATALLARVYLYIKDYQNAESQSSAIISNGTYGLETDLNKVFLKNSSETILQLGLNPPNSSIGNLTAEGYAILAYTPTASPHYYFAPQLWNAFETGDLRKVAWVDSTKYAGTVYYFPYKYKVGVNQYSADLGSATEYYMVLRLAEQYLIRAEARAQQGTNLSGAINDLNVIRNRAGLSSLPSNLTKDQILSAVAQERRIELFAEWGNRWFDLKRTGQIDAVMSVVTPQKNGGGTWKSYQQLYPIPQSELALDPNLTQNPGY